MPASLRQRVRARLARDAHTQMLDASVPRPIRMVQWVGHAVAIAMVAGVITLVWLDRPTASPPRGPEPIYVLIALGAGAALLCGRVTRRALRRAAAADHLRCPECMYDLRTLDATGTCPQCGRAYEHDAVRAQWLDAERRLIRK